MADRHSSGMGLWHTEEFAPPPSLPALGSPAGHSCLPCLSIGMEGVLLPEPRVLEHRDYLVAVRGWGTS